MYLEIMKWFEGENKGEKKGMEGKSKKEKKWKEAKKKGSYFHQEKWSLPPIIAIT